MPACCDAGAGSAPGGLAACGEAAWSAAIWISIDVIVCCLIGLVFGVLAILLELSVKLGEPLCVHKRFENAPDFELILGAAQLAQESHVDDTVDVPVDLVRQLGLIAVSAGTGASSRPCRRGSK